YEEAVYEGYGPGGVAVILETLSDNKNRTVAEVRHVFSKHNGNLAEKGAVAWMFAQKGVIEVDAANTTEDDVMLAVMDAGAEDIQDSDDVLEVVTAVDSFEAVKLALEENGISYSQASLAWIPQNLLTVEGGEAEKIIRLLDDIDDLDDVQKVSSNFDIQDDELEKLIG
ncbi:YebC/PmpR family DNA-binding transcriptional regulator, partial [Candidatus Latescibacterota bacterium]